jgi:hypothetical protein
MHCMVDADYIPWERLRADWLEITGDSFIVDVREAGTVVEGLKYCLKYLSKAPKLWGKDEQISEEEKQSRQEIYREATKGLRLVQPFGTLYRAITFYLPGVKCSECGGTAWICWEFELLAEWCVFLGGKKGPKDRGLKKPLNAALDEAYAALPMER